MKISILIGLIGIVVLGYSLTLEPYSDNEKFFDKYLELDIGQSEEYYELREDMLTPKYRLQDTGITLILLSIIAVVVLKVNKGFPLSPRKKYLFVVIAIALPFLTTAGYLFDLLQGMSRNEFPRWADSIGFAFIGIPFSIIVLLLWSLLHLLFIKEVKPLPITFSSKLNPWLLFISIITLVIVLVTLFWGQYWYAIPGLLWLYYYLSIGVNKLYFKTINSR